MATHRYWRLLGTGASQYNYVTEIELHDEVGGSDLTGSGTASACGQWSGSPPEAAVDNNTSTYWVHLLSTEVHWWSYDFGSGNAYDIVEFAVQPTAADSSQIWPGIILQYSDNNSDWTDVQTFADIDWADGGYNTLQTFTVGAEPSFNASWAINSNVIIQPGVTG